MGALSPEEKQWKSILEVALCHDNYRSACHFILVLKIQFVLADVVRCKSLSSKKYLPGCPGISAGN